MTGGVLAWIVGQWRARGLCERCGERAVADVTWAGTGRSELLCRAHWEQGEREMHAAYDARLHGA
jgi:hypothetical protein